MPALARLRRSSCSPRSALVPFALIARARVTTSARPRIQLIPDMDKQPKFKTQTANPLFADGRAMRPPVAGHGGARRAARGRRVLDRA